MPPDIMSIDSDISKYFLTSNFLIDKIGALTPSPFTDNLGGFEPFTMTGLGNMNVNRGHPLGTHYAGGVNQLGAYGGNISPSYMLQNHHQASLTHNASGFGNNMLKKELGYN